MMAVKRVASKQISKIVGWGKHNQREARAIRKTEKEDQLNEIREDLPEVAFKLTLKVEKAGHTENQID